MYTRLSGPNSSVASSATLRIVQTIDVWNLQNALGKPYVQLQTDFFTKYFRFQLHTAVGRGGLSRQSAEDPSLLDKHYFRYCYGPDLFFTSDGSMDKNPIHFWFPWLSDKLNSNEQLLEPLNFRPAESLSLELLLRAHTPGGK